MAVDVRLPKLSDEMAEATISRWLKAVGDSVRQGEPIVEVETEKVIVEVEAPQAGVILELVAEEQDVVPVDGILCRIGQPGEQPAPKAAPAPRAPAAPQAPARPASGASNVVSMPARAPAPEPPPERIAEPARPARVASAAGVAASPLARRVAQELGLDLSAVPGTGIGGKIVMADLQPYLDAGGTQTAQAVPVASRHADPASVTAVPHSPLRRTIARRMTEAKPGIPHFYMTAEVDVTELLALRERLNAAQDAQRISVNDLMLKATARALGEVPALNATYTDDAVQRHAAVHLGFAAAIDEGLVTPVVRDCHLKTVGQIAQEARALTERARARTLASADLQGGTFTISNLGGYDLVEFAAIINPPQVGILAIARPHERPVLREGQVVGRQLLRVTLSADHRAVDGVTGAEFLRAFQHTVEHPELFML